MSIVGMFTDVMASLRSDFVSTAPALNLSLHAKQGLCASSIATEILYGGAAGGGKSHLLRVIAITLACMVPGLQIYLFRRTFPELMKNHMEGPSSFPILLAPLTNNKQCKIVGDRVIRFWNGSTIFLCHCQHEKDRFNYHGAEIHVLLIDELTLFTSVIYYYLRSRVRAVGLKIPEQLKAFFPKIIAATNPGNVGHNWVKADFVDPAPELQMWRAPKTEGGMLRQYIPALLEDNPSMTADDPNYEDRLHGLGNEAYVKALRYGIWEIVSGGALDDVWDKSVHMLPNFSLPKNWPIYRAFDWGSSKPFSVAWFTESNGETLSFPDGSERALPAGSLIQIAEWYGWNGKPNEGKRLTAAQIAMGIYDRELAWSFWGKVTPGPADSSIFDVVDGRSISGNMRDVKLDEDNKISISFTPADKGPGSRKNGLELVRTMMLNSIGKPVPENPGLYFMERCRHSVRTLPVLPRDPDDPDDVDTDSEDHVYDVVRYFVQSRRRGIKQTQLRGL